LAFQNLTLLAALSFLQENFKEEFLPLNDDPRDFLFSRLWKKPNLTENLEKLLLMKVWGNNLANYEINPRVGEEYQQILSSSRPDYVGCLNPMPSI